ncbi:MAG: molybdopterin-dependent oxidoreductase [Actinomycetota bacterium]|nr:molybdopterin-dependent oxidoreductase [Actinomycetota bacterium]
MHPFRPAGRRTNLALLIFLMLALASGVAAFAVGSPGPARIVVVTHGVAGLAVVALAPWKSVVAWRGWRRRRPGRSAGLSLAVLVIIVLGSGLLHTLGGFRELLNLTPMQVHVGGAVIVVAVLLAHMTVHPTRPRRTDASRRSALGGLTLAASAGAAYAVLESAGGLLRLPVATRRQTGSHQLGTDAPAAMPITQWFTDAVPSIDASTWRVRLSAGGVSRELSPEKLAGADTVRAVLDCTNGWYSEQTWRGTRLDRLLPPGAGSSILVTSVTGYRRRLPAVDAPGLLLATHVAGVPLSAGHGAPVRLVAPGRRGFWWVKWVTAVELSDEPWWLQSPFPLQ